MHHVIQSFLYWPDGSIWGNLAAEILVALPAWVLGYFKLKKMHKRHHAEIMHHLNPQGLNQTEEQTK